MKKKRKPFVDYFHGFLYLLSQNGWEWVAYDDETDYYKYVNTFLGTYSVKVRAVVFEHPGHLIVNGYFGVGWLEFVDYPDCTRDENIGYGFGDLADIIHGMELAEENLIRIGMPFVPDYKFHGKNKANLKRRNDALRRKLNMERWEKEAMEKE